MLWAVACNAPLVDEPPISAEPSVTHGAPDSVTLDTNTQCALTPQAAGTLPDLPAALPTPPAEVPWTEASGDPLGTGYIGPVETAVNPDTPDYLLVGFANADWLKRVVLPLYDAPNGQVTSWMACGWWLEPEAEPTAMQPSLFYPGYSGFGLLVLAEEGDWLQFQEGGWVLRSHLQASPVPLAYMSWAKRYEGFMVEHATYAADDPAADWGYLFPNGPDTSLTLYPSPDLNAEPLTELAASASLLPLEMRGAWMHVRTYTPNNFCVEDWQGETQTGWIRWMNQDQGGNQLAEPYKGC